jgi:hypothetical protein
MSVIDMNKNGLRLCEHLQDDGTCGGLPANSHHLHLVSDYEKDTDKVIINDPKKECK